MTSRRRFLAALGLSFISAPVLFGQDAHRRRTRWEMFSHDEPIEAPNLKPDPSTWDDSTITAAWIGQSTVLINFFGTFIITDPVFSDRIGLDIAGLFTIGPRRLMYPALTTDELPAVDLILLSHAHMDHLDTPSLRKFRRTTPIVIAKNTMDIIESLGFEAVYELDWGQWSQIGDVRVEAFEVNHFGWRYPWERDRSRGYWEGRSYNAYLISKKGRHILFGGDTAYQEKFKKVRDRNIPIDLAILPIGCYDPWIQYHASPEQALEMADHMGAHYLLPIHWRTFIQSEEPTAEPIERLKKATATQPERVVLQSIGQTWTMGPQVARESAPTGTDTSTPYKQKESNAR